MTYYSDNHNTEEFYSIYKPRSQADGIKVENLAKIANLVDERDIEKILKLAENDKLKESLS